ncbi:Defensin J1-2 [Zostera marina]|uniref:Defensin J1-2 n=1 Tax=Zostera marina TaxID=29655 RepID=A0A0K9PWA6_ZOSMR|nr:Defensin J1-2 [Zostera marina]
MCVLFYLHHSYFSSLRKIVIMKHVFPIIIVFMLLLFSTGDLGTEKVAAWRTCKARSHRFRGLCFRSRKCNYICKTEGFHGGHCHGFRKRCICHKPC